MRGKERTHEASPESSLDMIGSACQPTQTACAHMLPTVPELLLRHEDHQHDARLRGATPASRCPGSSRPLSELPGLSARCPACPAVASECC